MRYCKEIDCKETVGLLCIHLSSVYRVLDRYDYETVVPAIHRSGPVPLLGKAEEYSVIIVKPEIYLSELQHELFQNTGTWASTSTIFRATCIQRLRFTREKFSRLY